MTPDFKNELIIVLTSWIFVFFSKLVYFLPQLQVIAVLLAIFSTFVTILLNISKIISIIKKLIK